ncbi:hypothetical protein TNCT_198761 [Trichonephila clavata]|uniref:Uncharacterized protein n=1 Tax=Trichonephila clavata TaxID=2740835 RepID=A0A8X6HVM2_TRICU|nr:hypothetical protein TNCT_198761 [Trichonephila clavata]
MALSLMLEIALHLIHWILYFASGHDMPSFFDVLIFEVGIEIIKNFYFKHHSTFETGTKNPLSLDVTELTNNNTAIPQVRSTTIYAICKALDLKAELVPFQDPEQETTQTTPKKAQCILTPPAVYSFTVFKICEALELKTVLRPVNERPVFKNKTPKPVPTVRSVAVFLMCQALELDVKLEKI